MNENALHTKLVGKTIIAIYIKLDTLKFITDGGVVECFVDGDCCSDSFFYDFYGVKSILGRKVKEVIEVENMGNADTTCEDTQCYGYKIVVEDPVWLELTGVFSFRNESNGYYGGNMHVSDGNEVVEGFTHVTDDILELKED